MNNELILERLKHIQNEILEITKLIYSGNNNEVFKVKKPIKDNEIKLEDILKVCGNVENETKKEREKLKNKKNNNKKTNHSLPEDIVKFGDNFNNDNIKEFFNSNKNDLVINEILNPIDLIDKNEIHEDNENEDNDIINEILNPIDLIDKNKYI